MPREQVGAGAERGRAAPVGSPGCKLRRSSLRPARPPGDGPSPRGPGAGGRGVCSRVPFPPGPRSPRGQHSRISARESARGCSPWLLRPRSPARPRSAPRRPAQRAHGPRPECGRAPPPQSQPGCAGRCGGRPRPLSAHAPPGPRRPARRWLLAVVAPRPRGRRRGSGRERGRLGGSCCCSAPQRCSGVCSLPLSSRVLHPSPRSALPPAACPGAHVTGACEHAPRGPGPRPHPRPHACARAPGPALPASAGSCPLSEGPERSRRPRAEADRWGRLPVASASGAGSVSSARRRVAGTGGPAEAPPRPAYQAPVARRPETLMFPPRARRWERDRKGAGGCPWGEGTRVGTWVSLGWRPAHPGPGRAPLGAQHPRVAPPAQVRPGGGGARESARGRAAFLC